MANTCVSLSLSVSIAYLFLFSICIYDRCYDPPTHVSSLSFAHLFVVALCVDVYLFLRVSSPLFLYSGWHDHEAVKLNP